MTREDDYETRSAHLKELSEKELEQRFWQLANKLVDPIIELAEKNTSPSIERSVLLRMGFSSIESKSIVAEAADRGILGFGAGNIVFRLAREKGLELRSAGLALAAGTHWNDVLTIFEAGGSV